jgi:hypothetical protein
MPTSISSNHSSKNDEELADINSKNQLVKSNINLNSSPSHFQQSSSSASSSHGSNEQQQHQQSEDLSQLSINKQAKKQKKSHSETTNANNTTSNNNSSINQSQSNSFDSSKTSISQLANNGNQSNTNSNSQYASALTQMMLNNALVNNNAATNPLQVLLNNPANSFLNNTSNGMGGAAVAAAAAPGYDFNLALKMYQIQLQSLMTANYLQSMRPTQQATTQQQLGAMPNSNLFSSLLGLSPEQLKQLAGGGGAIQTNLNKSDGENNASDHFKSESTLNDDGGEQDEESDEFESASLKNVKICINEVNANGNGKMKQLDSRNSSKTSMDNLKKFKNASNDRNPKLIKNK